METGIPFWDTFIKKIKQIETRNKLHIYLVKQYHKLSHVSIDKMLVARDFMMQGWNRNFKNLQMH